LRAGLLPIRFELEPILHGPNGDGELFETAVPKVSRRRGPVPHCMDSGGEPVVKHRAE